MIAGVKAGVRLWEVRMFSPFFPLEVRGRGERESAARREDGEGLMEAREEGRTAGESLKSFLSFGITHRFVGSSQSASLMYFFIHKLFHTSIHHHARSMHTRKSKTIPNQVSCCLMQKGPSS